MIKVPSILEKEYSLSNGKLEHIHQNLQRTNNRSSSPLSKVTVHAIECNNHLLSGFLQRSPLISRLISIFRIFFLKETRASQRGRNFRETGNPWNDSASLAANKAKEVARRGLLKNL